MVSLIILTFVALQDASSFWALSVFMSSVLILLAMNFSQITDSVVQNLHDSFRLKLK